MSEKQLPQSLAIAELAIEHIKRLNLSAEPASYEIWYNYVEGVDLNFNRFVDDLLADSNQLSNADLDEIRYRFFHRHNTADQLVEIGHRIDDEVEQIVLMVEAAIGVAANFDESLNKTNSSLALPVDRQALRSIIEAIVVATREMQRENLKLGANLNKSRQDIRSLQEDLMSVRMESLTDPLTQIANRRQLDHVLGAAIAEAERTSASLALLMADVDFFKKFNDDHGHQIGDRVLRLIATTLKQAVKGKDSVARYGGEEFAIVLPNTTLHDAVSVAENIRRSVAANDIIMRSTGENLGRVTISIGVAEFRAGMSMQGLIDQADACLYAAKNNGRNRVACETGL